MNQLLVLCAFSLSLLSCGGGGLSYSTGNPVKDNPLQVCTSDADCKVPGETCNVDPQSNRVPPGSICGVKK